MNLIINTASPDKIMVTLFRDKKLLNSLNIKAKRGQKDLLLRAIDRLLAKNKAKLKNLKGIIVVTGPGSFTGLRVGIVVANTLGQTLNIPVTGVKLADFGKLSDLAELGKQRLKRAKKGEAVLPFYNKEPNITKPS